MQGNDIEETINNHTFWMKYIPKGTFDMGDEHGGLGSDSQPIQKGIGIAAFYLAKYPVTQALWKAVMGEDNNPSSFKGNKRPVEMVSWKDAQVFFKELNDTDEGKKRQENDGLQYRLPSEAQWEYAARGGKNEPNERYAGSSNLKEVAWCMENSHSETKPVGLKLPNLFGLYDMSGNVYEWCVDEWKDTTVGVFEGGFPRKIKDNLPRKIKAERLRALRGGAWFGFDESYCVTDRITLEYIHQNDGFGFRLARY